MSSYELLAGVVALVLAVVVGTVVHEFAHAAVLRALGVPASIEWLPADDERGPLRAGVAGRWATVRPHALPADVPAWGLRLSAIVPLAMAVPLALVAAGAVPDPVRTGHLAVQLGFAGWLACALPSPGDFALFWNAEAVVAEPSLLTDPDADPSDRR